MSDPDFVIYVNVEGGFQADTEAVFRAAWYALSTAGMQPPLAMTVLVTTADHVQQLNRDYAGLDETTDVLSFAAEDQAYATEPGEPPYMGDVIISYPVAQQQAKTAGHTITAELQLLAIHGTLHLAGYDHDTPERQAEMWAIQSAAMDSVRAAGG
jgi:probable rRNA maturation factor